MSALTYEVEMNIRRAVADGATINASSVAMLLAEITSLRMELRRKEKWAAERNELTFERNAAQEVQP